MFAFQMNKRKSPTECFQCAEMTLDLNKKWYNELRERNEEWENIEVKWVS